MRKTTNKQERSIAAFNQRRDDQASYETKYRQELARRRGSEALPVISERTGSKVNLPTAPAQLNEQISTKAQSHIPSPSSVSESATAVSQSPGSRFSATETAVPSIPGSNVASPALPPVQNSQHQSQGGGKNPIAAGFKKIKDVLIPSNRTDKAPAPRIRKLPATQPCHLFPAYNTIPCAPCAGGDVVPFTRF
jgi:hypothetical protein